MSVSAAAGQGAPPTKHTQSLPENFLEALPHIAHPGVDLCVEPCVLGHERVDFLVEVFVVVSEEFITVL